MSPESWDSKVALRAVARLLRGMHDVRAESAWTFTVSAGLTLARLDLTTGWTVRTLNPVA
jgi:hypothetical protein